MNWKRIWTGALLAAIAIFPFEWFLSAPMVLKVIEPLFRVKSNVSINVSGMPVFFKIMGPFKDGYFLTFSIKSILIAIGLFYNSFIVGFALMWLYVMARSRLGPGPKTAIAMGTIAWLLFGALIPVGLFFALRFPLSTIVHLSLGRLLECWIGAFLASWQYIEKTP